MHPRASITRLTGPLAVLAIALAGVLASLGMHRLAARGQRSAPAGAPSRVILFAPNLNEAAWALGFEANIVAIDDYTVWPPSLLSRPRVGGMVDPNLERILALRPGLLVVQGESPQLRDLARANGIHLNVITMDTDLATVLAGFAALDSLLSGGAAPHAPAVVARIRGDLDAIGRAAMGLPHPRTLLVLGRDPQRLASIWTAGKGAFLTDLVAIAGGASVSAEQTHGYLELGLERLIADPPEVVIELRPGERVDEQALARARRIWRAGGLPAARVEICTFDGAEIPGPRVACAAARLFQLLHPQAVLPPLSSEVGGDCAGGAPSGPASGGASAVPDTAESEAAGAAAGAAATTPARGRTP